MGQRTTITISEATHRALRQRAAAEGVSFKTVVNQALEAGLSGGVAHRPYKLRPADLGETLAPVDHTLRLAGEMEDAELVRRMDLGK